MKRERIASMLGATPFAAPVFSHAAPAPTLTSLAGNDASDPPTFVWNAAVATARQWVTQQRVTEGFK